jgi:hypothetical protein
MVPCTNIPVEHGILSRAEEQDSLERWRLNKGDDFAEASASACHCLPAHEVVTPIQRREGPASSATPGDTHETES